VETEKIGRTIIYRLKLSVLEDALLGFAQTLGWTAAPDGARSPVTGTGPMRDPMKREA
jgi:hypothetical protein